MFFQRFSLLRKESASEDDPSAPNEIGKGIREETRWRRDHDDQEEFGMAKIPWIAPDNHQIIIGLGWLLNHGLSIASMEKGGFRQGKVMANK